MKIIHKKYEIKRKKNYNTLKSKIGTSRNKSFERNDAPSNSNRMQWFLFSFYLLR